MDRTDVVHRINLRTRCQCERSFFVSQPPGYFLEVPLPPRPRGMTETQTPLDSMVPRRRFELIHQEASECNRVVEWFFEEV